MNNNCKSLIAVLPIALLLLFLCIEIVGEYIILMIAVTIMLTVNYLSNENYVGR